MKQTFGYLTKHGRFFEFEHEALLNEAEADLSEAYLMALQQYDLSVEEGFFGFIDDHAATIRTYLNALSAQPTNTEEAAQEATEEVETESQTNGTKPPDVQSAPLVHIPVAFDPEEPLVIFDPDTADIEFEDGGPTSS